ncbi:MAG TPA: 2-hydroxychromene-2-carboxylate dehydrogenase, partial [Caulobacteraceae bacterium]
MKPAVSRLVTGVMTSPARRELTRAAAGLRRKLSGARPVVDYFHQADDPYSALAVQLVEPLAERYGLTLRPWVVPPPDDAAAPERERLAAYARRDAGRLAAAYGLDFPAAAAAPSAEAVALAQRILVGATRSGAFASVAAEASSALWSGDAARLQALASAAALPEETGTALAVARAERARLGHYLGAMLHFEGEWCWGVDRLHHLEARLAAMGRDTAPGAAPLAPFRDARLEPPRGAGGA